ncbi:DUF1365 domain-containing protein [Acidimangrovimonas pyrenivorans]|uniref:DUF1365 domain-containing protein n=1 Tax=Acidimangrovimonas pyrenivorans TaxID=2030798 RepID=A0ABV7AFA6_9RHOB
MNVRPEILRAETTHARRGATRHGFRHRVDYLLLDPEAAPGGDLLLFSRNRVNLASVDDRLHGGPRGAGRGAAWARQVLAGAGAPRGLALRLLTQPRFLGLWFTPVSFWLAFDGGALVAVIAEVNNTFGERHSYLCAHPGFAPITARDRLQARKVFHVSPFQDLAGAYSFTFEVTPALIAITITLRDGSEGVVATLSGRRAPLTDHALLAAALRRPFGPLRTLALIYWHALRLKAKGVAYRPKPIPPEQEVSR